MISELAEVAAHVSLQNDAAGLHLLELASVMPATDRFLHQYQLLGQHLVPALLQKRVLCILSTHTQAIRVLKEKLLTRLANLHSVAKMVE